MSNKQSIQDSKSDLFKQKVKSDYNCPSCGTAELIRVLIIGDNIAASMTLAILGLGQAARKAAEEFRQSAPWKITTTAISDLSLTLIVLDEAVDSQIHLAPNHQDYTPNHRKQRRDKFKRGGK